MCSYRCESPLYSGGSVSEPFLAAISTVTSGTAWFSTTSTVRPLGKVCCWISGAAAVAASGVSSAARVAATSGRSFMGCLCERRTGLLHSRRFRGVVGRMPPCLLRQCLPPLDSTARGFPVRRILALLLLVVALPCAAMDYTPTMYPLRPGLVAPLHVAGDVSIVNGQDSTSADIVYKYGSVRVSGRMDDGAQVGAEQTRAGLGRRGAATTVGV